MVGSAGEGVSGWVRRGGVSGWVRREGCEWLGQEGRV